MSIWHRIFRLAPASLSLLCILAALTRLTVQDRWPGPSLLYYAMPPVVLAVLLVIAGGLWLWTKYRRLGLANLVAGLACAIWWYQACYIHSSTTEGPSHLRVVFWNVAHGFFGWNAIDWQIANADADVIGLCEANRRGRDDPDWQRLYPDYEVSAGPSGLVLLTRGKILDEDYDYLGRRGWCKHLRIELQGRQLDIVLIDLKARPLYSRQDHFRKLNAVLDTLPERPALLMGDFNTPPDSVFFESIRRHYQNAFESSGSGHHATWPIPLPVLALDQIWASAAIEVHHCRLGWTWCSDHRPVIAELEIP